ALLLAIAWCTSVGGGFVALTELALAPGDATVAPDVWPIATAIERDPTRPTLVMFVHPHCACTRARRHELDRLRTAVGAALRTIVVIVRPDDLAGGGLTREDLVSSASASYEDARGVEAERFGALTSGAVVVYDAAGRLAFSGGITPARSHE